MTSLAKTTSELDVIALATRPASLVVLSDTTDAAGRLRFERVLSRIGGSVLATLPPRLVVAQLPDHADALLAQLGVVARFDRAVAAGEIPGETLDESRFAAVYSNRWHRAEVAGAARITPRRSVRRANEPFEGPPLVAAPPARLGKDPEDSVSTPYASGTVVVSIVLPESNGTIDASTEDWNEDLVREAYLKVQAAVDAIAETEANANLRFILHYESAPADRGLAGTVDTAYEYGQRAQFDDWANESLATADVLSKILGHPVSADEAVAAAYEYDLSLRRRYDADAAFFVIVAANHNGTAGLRPHARINGPWATLDSTQETSVFMHEFGHVFGALDEYCSDICLSPLTPQGYLGIYNANALFREGDWGGIDEGKGESAPSLMDTNVMGAVNGYTRGAWGWLDRDGDGIIEVRDTFPKSQLETSVTGQTVRLAGEVVDVPEPRSSDDGPGYSVNHVTSLNVEIERGGAILDAIDLPLPGDTRGRQAVDVSLPPLPPGEYVLRVRAKNEVGNVEPKPLLVRATVGATGNTPPIPHLTLPEANAVSSSKSWSIKASAVDLDGDAPEVRIDLGADGSFDTPWAASQALDVTPSPGVYPIVVEARDPSGATASTRGELLVFEENAPPAVRLEPVPSLVHGMPRAALDLTASARDPEGGPIEYSWIAELATNDGVFRRASGWGPSNRFSIELPTPETLVSRRLSLAADDDVAHGVDDVLPLGPSTIAVASGWNGVWFLDVTDPAAPTMLSRIRLETAARKLWRDRDRLYVLGSKLTIVDIADLGRPTEIRQLTPVDTVVTSTSSDELPIGEDVSAMHSHYVEGDRIQATEIRVTTDHPRPAELRVILYPPRETGVGPITLRDREAAPPGLNTWTFNDANTPALAALRGLPASESWTIEVIDDVSDRVVGSLVSSRIEFQTRSFGAEVLAGANEIVGKLWTGDLVIAGRGVQVVSVADPTCVRERSRLDGLPSVGATLDGSTVVMATTLQDKAPSATLAPVKGIAAVDLAIPTKPRLVQKVIPDGAPSTLRRVGSRAYVRLEPTCERGTVGCEDPKPSTLVIDASRFASGRSAWQLGRSALLVDGHAFGDDNALWTVGSEGYVQRYDVADPANLRLSLAYPRNRAESLVPFGPLTDGSDLLLLDGSIGAAAADRDRTENLLSRVYRVSVEARDAAGAVTRQYRTVHVNPYDHAPTVSRIEQEDGTVPGETVFSVFGSDPDSREMWNPDVFFRVDWDGDGVFDTEWSGMTGRDGYSARISKVFDQPGTYEAVFEIRDGYYASQSFLHTIVVP